jgi:chorismate dehydratase
MTHPKLLRIGSVSYLNAKPLIYGLERARDLELDLAIPAKLIDGLSDGVYDVALLPAIDYQRMDGLRVVPSGGIGSDGTTLTVRIFSAVPIEQIRTLACDADSHTSVALARILLAERHQCAPEFIVKDSRAMAGCDARLLIGDKVVCEEPENMPFQLDLGEGWKALTGLPFLFAVWVARQGVALGDLPARLKQAREQGMQHIDEIIERHAIPRGWPGEVARQYLTRNLQFEVGARQLEAMRLFHSKAAGLGLIASPAKPLVIEKTEAVAG